MTMKQADKTLSGQDVPDEGLTVDGAAEALLARWKAAEEGLPEDGKEGDPEPDGDDPETTDPDAGEAEEATDEAPEGTEDDPEETPTEPEEEPEEPEPEIKLAEDDMQVSIKVGEEEYRVSVKDLKRLYGQEASLTRKSQEVAEERKTVTEQGQKYATALSSLVEKAQERWKPYAEIDWLVAAQRMDGETLTQLRKDARGAFEDYKFLVEELDGHMQKAATEAHQKLREAAKETVKALKDPEGSYYVEGWDDEVYQSILDFAVDHGIPKEAIQTETSPAAIKLVWMAQQYMKAKEEAARVSRTKKPVAKTAKKVLRPGSAGGTAPKEVKRAAAMKRLKQTGSLEDAAEAFLTKWEQ